MFVDTHAHLQSSCYADDLDVILNRAAQAGVSACIVIGTDLESSRAAVALAEASADGPCALYAAVGIHPTDTDTLTAGVLADLETLARHPRVVAIGEIGLDYYWPQMTDRDWPCAGPEQQRRAFRTQLELAAALGLPVIIHDRDAHADTLELLAAWVHGHPGCTGVLHAYAGGLDHLPAVLDLGFSIGMDGPVTFPKATGLRAVAREVPLDRLLLETDCPYLTPIPYRGRRNEPAYLPYVAQTIAETRGIEITELAEVTTQNAQRIFKL
ncbi:MAG: TatD family hydrolase [Anaerolineae bacterium]|jgi:TatD DNase family protein|nr:TatD family hydrolase [Anaerolineae bacterium]